MTLVEIALDDVAGARIAERAGAHRIELCAGLSDGGTTPSIGLVREVANQLSSAALMVLIRPRAGDFVYSNDELRVMLGDIDAIRAAAPSAGFVIGALDPSGDIDEAMTAALVAACSDASVTFHKAFDSTRDLSRSLETLVALGVRRVLTSGGRRTAVEGSDVLRSLVEQAAGRITVMAGGSVRADTVAGLVDASGVREVHLRAAVARPSASEWTNPEQDYETSVVSATDGGAIRAVLAGLRGTSA